jgi:hypothetical protein
MPWKRAPNFAQPLFLSDNWQLAKSYQKAEVPQDGPISLDVQHKNKESAEFPGIPFPRTVLRWMRQGPRQFTLQMMREVNP